MSQASAMSPAPTKSPNPQYFMQDQARRKVKNIMSEGWFHGPAGALLSLLAIVSALSILGGMDAAQAETGLALLSGLTD